MNKIEKLKKWAKAASVVSGMVGRGEWNYVHGNPFWGVWGIAGMKTPTPWNSNPDDFFLAVVDFQDGKDQDDLLERARYIERIAYEAQGAMLGGHMEALQRAKQEVSHELYYFSLDLIKAAHRMEAAEIAEEQANADEDAFYGN